MRKATTRTRARKDFIVAALDYCVLAQSSGSCVVHFGAYLLGGIHAYLTLTHPYMVMVGVLIGICVQVQVVLALHAGGARYTNQM